MVATVPSLAGEVLVHRGGGECARVAPRPRSCGVGGRELRLVSLESEGDRLRSGEGDRCRELPLAWSISQRSGKAVGAENASCRLGARALPEPSLWKGAFSKDLLLTASPIEGRCGMILHSSSRLGGFP